MTALPDLVPKRGMPVTLITGFLGSGKTTLLNHILTNRQDLKVAVLVNEFGDIDIDSQLLVSVEENMVGLSNGCICCTINDSLVDAVYSVLEREERIDYLVVETTGVADPLPIMLTFLSEELKPFTRLDSVITVVDATVFDANHFVSQAALSQLTYADVILLNKADLATKLQLSYVERQLQSFKEEALLLRCSLTEEPDALPLEVLLDVGGNASSKEALFDALPLSTADNIAPLHLKQDGFVAVPFKSDRPFQVEKFTHFLTEQMPMDVFRAKGILWFEGREERHIFQLSGKRCDIELEPWTTPPKNQLVFIGRGLNPLQLNQQLINCLTGSLMTL
ncbi:MAG: CobW family GTP-binding protein [Elainellaceae cyanobacterium]